MKTPKFLRALMSSPAYMNKNSNEYTMTEKYLKMLYPGTVQPDATGRMMSAAYDMTLAQFYDTQQEIELQIKEAAQKADYEDAEQYIDEVIEVQVLMPWGEIESKKLYVYALNIPDADQGLGNKSEETYRIWRWHSESGDNSCEECASRDGVVYENEKDIPSIPPHPNCRCYITEEEIDADGQELSSKPYKSKNKKEAKDMKISNKGIEWLKNLEGSVKVDGKHVIYNDATGQPVPDGAPLPPGATIGYGHLIKAGEDFSKGLTEAEATELFQQDLQSTYDTITKQIDHNILASMPQHKYDALVSLVFNIGPGSAAPANANRGLYQSTIRKYINDKTYKSNTYPSPEAAWKAFRNQGYLDRRRDAEWRLYHSNDYSGYR